jgi:hypothetical protein
MLVFLLSLILVATAFFFGVLVVHTISIIPISILARAEQGGRYVRLGACGLLLPRSRTGGRRSPPRMAVGGHRLSLAGAEAG